MLGGRWPGTPFDPDTVRSTDWTVSHFFIDVIWYYNFPYAFGMLFGLGLLAARDADPEGFFARFDEMLADSGMCEAAELAGRFGIDLRDPAFWRTSLDLFRADVDRYEALAAERKRMAGKPLSMGRSGAAVGPHPRRGPGHPARRAGRRAS